MARKSKSDDLIVAPIMCESLADVDALLGELWALDSQKARVGLDVEQAAKLLADNAVERLRVDIDGVLVPIADRRRAIEATLEGWCAAHRAEILEEGSKSRILNRGTIGWRENPDRIDPIKGSPAAGNANMLDAIVGHLRRALSKFADLATPLVDCLSIQVKWQKPCLGKGLAEQKFTPAELRSIGFKKTEGEDEFFCTPADVTVVSLSAAAAGPV